MENSSLDQVLNLVRHEAQKNPTVKDPFAMTEPRARNLIESAAALVQRACQFPPEILTEIANHSVLCACHRQMGSHCGACQEYDKAHACNLAGEPEEDTCAA